MEPLEITAPSLPEPVECVLEISQDGYKTPGSTKMRLFDIKNDRQHLVSDEEIDHFEIKDDLSEEEYAVDEDRALFDTASEKKLKEYLSSTGAVIKKVRFLWNF